MRKIGAFELKSSGVYGRAAEGWRTVFDHSLDQAYKVAERRAELEALLTAILNHHYKFSSMTEEVA
jgi:chromosome partitioning protein